MTNPGLDQRYPDGWWDGETDYFDGSRILPHNDDYLEFLISLSYFWWARRHCS